MNTAVKISPTASKRHQRHLELFARIREGDQAAVEEMVRCNTGLVSSVARYYCGKTKHSLDSPFFLDLMQEGRIGLLRAIREWDPERAQFSTMAHPWIRQAIQRYATTQTGVIRVPAHAHREADPTRRHQARVALESQGGIESSEGCPMVEDVAICEPDDLIERSDDQAHRSAHLEAAFAKLPPRTVLILKLRFGFGGQEPKTLSEISRQLGLSRERIRQIEDYGLLKLRRFLKTGVPAILKFPVQHPDLEEESPMAKVEQGPLTPLEERLLSAGRAVEAKGLVVSGAAVCREMGVHPTSSYQRERIADLQERGLWPWEKLGPGGRSETKHASTSAQRSKPAPREAAREEAPPTDPESAMVRMPAPAPPPVPTPARTTPLDRARAEAVAITQVLDVLSRLTPDSQARVLEFLGRS